MARYDTASSGYQDRLPGFSPTDPHGYSTAQGSAGAGADGAAQIWDTAANLAATSVTSPLIVPVQDTLAAGVHVDVHPGDTEVGGQIGLYSEGTDPFSGIPRPLWGDSGAGKGHAGHFRHPNGLQAEGTPEGHA